MFPAKYPGKCAFGERCLHGGSIAKGETIEHCRERGARGINAHSDCLHQVGNGSFPAREDEPATGTTTTTGGSPDAGRAIWELVRDEAERALTDRIAEAVAEAVAELEGEQRTVVLVPVDSPPVTVDCAHPAFGTLAAVLGAGLYAYVSGPAGSGKSYGAEQYARATGAAWGYQSLCPLTSPTVLTGFMSPNGTYVRTPFRDCYEFGGVFCLDELDNTSEVLTTSLNNLIESNAGAFPDAVVPKHAEFRLVATGNTPGYGPTERYPSRRQIDPATLSRFAKLDWQYDEPLERKIARQIAGATGAKWAAIVHACRAFLENPSNGARNVYATPRAVYQGAKLIMAGAESNPRTLLNLTVFGGCSDQIRDRALAAVAASGCDLDAPLTVAREAA